MKVLMCCGKSTEKLSNQIASKVSQGNIDILCVPYIYDIKDIFERGEFFDRAIIMDKGLTDDGKDKTHISEYVDEFVQVYKKKCTPSTTLIFVTNNEEDAAKIADETIEVSAYSRILVRTANFTMAYFKSLITSTLDGLPENEIYTIKAEEVKEDIRYSNYSASDVVGTVEEVESAQEVDLTDMFNRMEDMDTPDEAVSSVLADEDDDIEIKTPDYNYDDPDDEPDIDVEVEVEPTADYAEDEDEYNDFFGIGSSDTEDSDTEPETEEELETEPDYEEELETEIEEELGEIETEVDTEPDTSTFTAVDKDYTPPEIPQREYIDTDTTETEIADSKEFEETIERNPDDLESDYESLFGTEIKNSEESTEEEIETEIDADELSSETETETEVELEQQEEETVGKEVSEDDIDLSVYGVESFDDPVEEEDVEIDNDAMNDVEELFGSVQGYGNASAEVQDLFDINEDNVDEPEEQEEPEEPEEPVRPATPADKKNKRGLLGGKKNTTSQPKAPKQSGGGLLGRRSIEKESEKLRKVMASYRSRGCSIVVTGASSTGKTSVVYNLAKLISDMGYNALIVDFDTMNKSQGYISKMAFESVHSMDTENPSLMMAINASAANNAVQYANILQPGLHLLTLGLASDAVPIDKLVQKTKISRFASNVRNSYNFIIYDMPFDAAVGFCEDITSTADSLILLNEFSTKGFMETLVKMSNIASEEMMETMFLRSRMCVTKMTDSNIIMGMKMNSIDRVMAELDKKVMELLGVEAEFLFKDIKHIEPLRYDTRYNDSWLSNKAYVDYPDGKAEYTKMLCSILFNEWSA